MTFHRSTSVLSIHDKQSFPAPSHHHPHQSHTRTHHNTISHQVHASSMHHVRAGNRDSALLLLHTVKAALADLHPDATTMP